MDAFLKPSEETDSTGTPLRLKTLTFYQQINQILKPNGVVAFNLNEHATIQNDIETIQSSFERSWIIKVPKRRNIVVISSNRKDRVFSQELIQNSIKLDKKHKDAGFKYSNLTGTISVQ